VTPSDSSLIPHPSSLRIDCPPKVNLYLRVVRRRPDGYHELETVFQSVGGGDTLTVWPAERITLICSDPEIPSDERNLVIRAARLLQERCPTAATCGAAMHLTKRTPSGAGMGGGSVDGAAALVLLSRLWRLDSSLIPHPSSLVPYSSLIPHPSSLMSELAAALGSDVPFFLRGGTALARGRGEELSALPTAPLWLVLVKPPVSVSTPWAYRQWRPEECGGPSVEEFISALASREPEAVAAALRNDLEPGVGAGVPEIPAAREWLLSRGALGARMTGSGSVVFGVARDEEHARSIAGAGGAPGTVWAAPCLTAEQAKLVPPA